MTELPSSTGKNRSTEILSLEQIAWWWLPGSLAYLPTEKKAIWAELPPIQRGFVWNANQIERLWDSIASGFPLGSLLLQAMWTADIERLRGATRPAQNTAPKWGAERGGIPEEAKQYFFILDGQQRATSIALGFRNDWEGPQGCERGLAKFQNVPPDSGGGGLADPVGGYLSREAQG